MRVEPRLSDHDRTVAIKTALEHFPSVHKNGDLTLSATQPTPWPHLKSEVTAIL